MFPCTWEFKVGNGAAKAMPVVTHRQTVDSAGKCTISAPEPRPGRSHIELVIG